jgi:ATP-binding cassette subfamily A (ABC1) protein 3
MLSITKRSQWRRIYHQTLTLIYKNFLIFYKAPISTTIRALIFPIILTIILCELKHISETSSSFGSTLNGISDTSYPIKDLADAVSATSQRKLVFVRNGLSNESLGSVIDGILQEPGMEALDILVTDDPNDLFVLCHQSLQGSSDCFAAVIFSSFNGTNVEYIIALDESITNDYSSGDYRTDASLLTSRILPIQWAVDSHIGNFSRVSKPSEQPWTGSFGLYSNPPQSDQSTSNGEYVCIIRSALFLLDKRLTPQITCNCTNAVNSGSLSSSYSSHPSSSWFLSESSIT